MLTTTPQTASISSVFTTMCTWLLRMYAACGASDSDTSIANGVGVPSVRSTGRNVKRRRSSPTRPRWTPRPARSAATASASRCAASARLVERDPADLVRRRASPTGTSASARDAVGRRDEADRGARRARSRARRRRCRSRTTRARARPCRDALHGHHHRDAESRAASEPASCAISTGRRVTAKQGLAGVLPDHPLHGARRSAPGSAAAINATRAMRPPCGPALGSTGMRATVSKIERFHRSLVFGERAGAQYATRARAFLSRRAITTRRDMQACSTRGRRDAARASSGSPPCTPGRSFVRRQRVAGAAPLG